MALARFRQATERLKVARTSPESWSVVATVREPLTLLKAFVAHHLGLGAAHIYLYFDDPLDTSADVLERLDRVTVFRCDAAHWQRIGEPRPEGHWKRQVLNANHLYPQCPTDWLCHIDADEFLTGSHEIGRAIAHFGRGFGAIRVWPAERVFLGSHDADHLEFDGYFKRAHLRKARIGRQLFGPVGAQFRAGFLGHTVGKMFVRTGQENIWLQLHAVVASARDGRMGKSSGKARLEARSLEAEEIILAHYMPLDFWSWKYKIEKYLITKGYFDKRGARPQPRQAVFAEAAAGGDAAMRKLFATLAVMDAAQEALLRRHDALIRLEFGIADKLAAVFRRRAVEAEDFAPVLPKGAVGQGALPKVFQIGMSNCGTRDLCRQFARRGLGYAHFDAGRIAEAIDGGRLAAFPDFDRIQLFANLLRGSDMGEVLPSFERVKALSEVFDDACFILNRRSALDWAESLTAKLSPGERQALAARLGAGSDAALIEALTDHWQAYLDRVTAHFAGQKRLIELRIDSARPGYLFEKLADFGYPRGSPTG